LANAIGYHSSTRKPKLLPLPAENVACLNPWPDPLRRIRGDLEELHDEVFSDRLGLVSESCMEILETFPLGLRCARINFDKISGFQDQRYPQEIWVRGILMTL